VPTRTEHRVAIKNIPLSMNGISALIYLETKLSLENKIACNRTFIDMGFSAYHYEEERYVDASVLLTEEYLEFDRCSMRYKTEDFVFSSSVNKDFISYSIDGNTDESNVIVSASDRFADILDNFKHAHIDSEGDRPNGLSKTIENLQLKYFFKYNFFGKTFIGKYGRDFFKNFPAEKAEFLSEDVVRIDLVQDVFGTISERTQEKAKNYLNNHGISDVQFYDHKKHRYD
jgi:hypothetical protein